RSRIAAKIMAGDNFRRDATLLDQRAHPKPDRLHSHQVDLGSEQPARVVFAEARGLHQRLRFVIVGIGSERELRFRKHRKSCCVARARHIAQTQRRTNPVACNWFRVSRSGRVLAGPNMLMGEPARSREELAYCSSTSLPRSWVQRMRDR